MNAIDRDSSCDSGTAVPIYIFETLHALRVAFGSLLVFLLVFGIGGCSVLWPTAAHEESASEEVLLEPIARNKFELQYPGQEIVGEPQIIYARWEDTFPDIAREYGLGYDELREANPDIDPWMPGKGTAILLPTQYVLPSAPRDGIVLNLASKRMFYYPPVAEGEPLRVITYPVGIGRVGWNTPLGETRVVAKATDPSWNVPISIRREHAAEGDPLPAVVPPGPDNPLGRHALRLGMPSYLIHGTNKPFGVGMRVSHGCVRLYPENIESLYEMVGVRERVAIVNQPYLLALRDGDFYLEAHVPLEDDEVPAEEHLLLLLETAQDLYGAFLDEADQRQVRAITEAAQGVPVRILHGGVDDVNRRARVVRNTVVEPKVNSELELNIEKAPEADGLDEGSDMDSDALSESGNAPQHSGV